MKMQKGVKFYYLLSLKLLLLLCYTLIILQAKAQCDTLLRIDKDRFLTGLTSASFKEQMPIIRDGRYRILMSAFINVQNGRSGVGIAIGRGRCIKPNAEVLFKLNSGKEEVATSINKEVNCDGTYTFLYVKQQPKVLLYSLAESKILYITYVFSDTVETLQLTNEEAETVQKAFKCLVEIDIANNAKANKRNRKQ